MQKKEIKLELKVAKKTNNAEERNEVTEDVEKQKTKEELRNEATVEEQKMRVQQKTMMNSDNKYWVFLKLKETIVATIVSIVFMIPLKLL